MKRILVGIVAVGLAGVAPQPAAAQDGGWWEWALREVVESVDGRESRDAPVLGGRDKTRGADSRSAGTLADIILGRDRDARDRDDSARSRGRDRDGKGRGPAFCRSGEGHPVFGRQWCREKGFGLGSGVSWEQRGWEDVILRSPRGRDRQGVTDRGGLIDILGDVVYGRLVEENRRIGGTQPLSGRWIRPGGVADVLQIRSGSVPVAELSDLDGDGRVEAVLIRRR